MCSQGVNTGESKAASTSPRSAFNSSPEPVGRVKLKSMMEAVRSHWLVPSGPRSPLPANAQREGCDSFSKQ